MDRNQLIVVILLCGSAFAQVGGNLPSRPRRFTEFTVSTLPAASTTSGQTFLVTDAAVGGSCTTGGGSNKTWCRSNGSTYDSVNGNYVDLSTNQTAAGNKTLSGLTTLANVNSRVMCDQSAGATFDLKVNACIATVIAAGGGIADATGLTGAQTGTTEIDVGNASSIPVTLLLSPFLTYTATNTTAGACFFKVFDASRLIGTVIGTTHQAMIKNTSGSTATGSQVCTNYTAGTGQYVSIQGLILYNPGAPSNTNFTNGAMFIKNLFDTSSIRDMVIANEGGDGLVIEASCCASLFFNIITDGNHAAGARPLVIKSLTGDIQPINAIALHNISADHPGAGLSAITIQHTFASSLLPCSIAFTGMLYMEGNSTDTTTPLMNIDSCQLVSIQAITAQFRSVTSTAVPINVTHASLAGTFPVVTLMAGQIQNSPQTFPMTFINDAARSLTYPTDASFGYVSNVDTGVSKVFQFRAPLGVADTDFGASSGVGLHVRVNVNNLNPLRLEDSTLVPRAIDLGPNVTSNGTFGIRDATGAKNLVSFSWVSPFTATFAGPIATGTTPPACTAGTAGFWCATEGTAPTNVASTSAIYADSTTHEYMAVTNGASSASPGMMVRRQPSAINNTAKSAAVTTANLCAASAGSCNTAGQYRLTYNVWGSGTACATVTAGSVVLNFTWTDENAVTHTTINAPMWDQKTSAMTAGQVNFNTALGTEGGSGSFVISTNGTIIQYATTYTACTSGTGTYNLRIAVERLQ